MRRADENRLLSAAPEAIRADANLAAIANDIAKPAFEKNCAACHRDGSGDSTRGVPAFVVGGWLYGSGEVLEVERTIAHGIRAGDPKGRNLADMPAFARANPYAREKIDPLSPDDIEDAAEFVVSLSGAKADAASVARGKALFEGRGGCSDCHGGDARGDQAVGGPSLTGPRWLWGDGSRDSLRESIARGHAGVCPAWGRRLEPATVRALAVYVVQLADNRAKGKAQ
jgi:cytochrome c oxidase cbb3-type subunit 3